MVRKFLEHLGNMMTHIRQLWNNLKKAVACGDIQMENALNKILDVAEIFRQNKQSVF